MSPCLCLLLTPFFDLQVQIHAHRCVELYTPYSNTHTQYTSPRERAPSYTQTHRLALCAGALLHTCSHRPTVPSHTRTPSSAYVCRPTDMAGQPSAETYVPVHSNARISVLVRMQKLTCTDSLRRCAHSTHRPTRGRSELREVSLVHVSFTSPHRWLCLEDRLLRKQLLGLVGTGSPEFTIDFCLSLTPGPAHQR